MITLSEISKDFHGRTLFENVNISFNPGNRYGLTGPNGSGKSTLMRIIMGLEPSSSGTVTLPKKVGMLRQNIEDFKEMSVLDTVIMGNARLWKTLEERDRLYEGEMTDEVGLRLGELEEVIAEENGYEAESEAEQLLMGMHIPLEEHQKKMGEIPSDIQFQVLLCQALFGEPEALLLDEPTNHLDLEAIGWLEEFLHNYKGTLIVTSHDRHFLNTVTTHIADIDYETIIIYPGNYDDMVDTKAAVSEREQQDAKSKEKKIAQLQEFVSKFSAGSRSSQVQSRIKEMDRLKPQEQRKTNIQRPYIRFIPQEKAPGQILLKAEGICKAYDEEVIKNFSFELHRGDKVGVIGNNGRGKTTLLKMLSGYMEPDKGSVSFGHNVATCYFPQDHGDVIDKQNCKDNVFEWMRARKNGIYDQDIRGALGKLLFAGDDAFKSVATLSGGETARLLISGMMLSDHNLLIMDEPNNHLDLESVSALTWGLNEYKGSVIIACHDRDLISQVANRIIAFEEDKPHIYDGTLEEYLKHREKVTR